MRRFPAKTLLFGEYSVLSGSSALSLPCFLYGGSLQLPGQSKQGAADAASNHILKDFMAYLQGWEGPEGFDFIQFEEELSQGLFFESDIPQNYGLGSSGALVAAVFDRFSPGTDERKLADLKVNFARAESFFHGKSSGIDPLTCFLQTPLLIDQQGIHPADAEDMKAGLAPFYLFDTGVPGATGKGVKVFLESIGQLSRTVYGHYITRVDEAIEALFTGDARKLEDCMNRISAYQLEYFAEMIPGALHGVWLQGLHSGDFRFKLCGSGGGGYMLFHSGLEKRKLEIILKTRLIPVAESLFPVSE